MARTIPPERLGKLVTCATDAFIRKGYRGTLLGDIAEDLGVAKGTVYLYVESKEALFDLVCHCADQALPEDLAASTPWPTPAPGATLAYAAQRIGLTANFPRLQAALTQPDTNADPVEECRAVLTELYDVLHANRTGIRLLEAAARDLPEIAALWFTGGREGNLAMLDAFIRDRIDQGRLAEPNDVATAVRLVLETTVFWAVHRHWDTHPHHYDEDRSRLTVIEMLSAALRVRPEQ